MKIIKALATASIIMLILILVSSKIGLMIRWDMTACLFLLAILFKE